MPDEPALEAPKGPWSPSQVDRFLQETCIPLRLACHGTSGFPVLASLWFLWRDGALWCATRPDSAVARHLGRDPRCGFEVASDEPPYRGVRGAARAPLDEQAGRETLELLLRRYTGGLDGELARWLLERADDEVALRLEPVRWSTWDYSDRMEGS